MDLSNLAVGQPVAEQTDPGFNRLPAGSTLEVLPGVRVPHPEAAATPAGTEDPRKGGDAVNELLNGIVKVNTVGEPAGINQSITQTETEKTL